VAFKLPHFFQLHVHGQWPTLIDLYEDNPKDRFSVLGFHTTRWVAAPDIRSATRKAEEAIRTELQSRLDAHPTTMDRLELKTDEVWQVGAWRYLRRRPGRGFTFYSEV